MEMALVRLTARRSPKVARKSSRVTWPLAKFLLDSRGGGDPRPVASAGHPPVQGLGHAVRAMYNYRR
ncbi:MAG: hypothetical protein U1F77_15535 [Kiritimatiellia bacterium]